MKQFDQRFQPKILARRSFQFPVKRRFTEPCDAQKKLLNSWSRAGRRKAGAAPYLFAGAISVNTRTALERGANESREFQNSGPEAEDHLPI